MTEPAGRRSLLTGGVGLLVGAGAGAAVGRATAQTSPLDGLPRFPSPGEELMTEHGVLKRVLLAYRAISTRLGKAERVPREALVDAAQIVADYVESFHEGLEEAYVFPRVAAHAAYTGVVETLLAQHDRGRHLTSEILVLAASDSSRPSAREPLRARLDAFVTMYEPHEAWEDTVIYPALRALTPSRTLDELAARFADLEAGRYSDLALARILERVEGVEQQLGIGDLASFTAPSSLTFPLSGHSQT
ncbi:MAG: hemerythrin domain-containing protein [Nocardioides sp.]